MATNSTLRQYTAQQVAYALNIKDPTPNSKITNLIETVINEMDNFESMNTGVIDNMFIETCNSEYLDRVGSQEGILRGRTRSFKISKSTNMVGIKNLSGRNINKKYLRNSSIRLEDNLYITLLEDLDLLTVGETLTPISVELKTNEVRSNNLSIIKGSSYLTDFENVYIEFVEEISIPLIEESEEEYRARVLFARGTSNFGSESAIKSCIASSSFVDSYTIDYDTTPPTIYIFNRGMLTIDDYGTNLEVYSKPIISSHLNLKKSDGTGYELALPTAVTFKIAVEARVDNPRPLALELFSFSDYIVKSFRLGEEYVVNTDMVRQHLISLSVDLSFLDDYNITLFKTYLNFEYAAENNSITIYKNEYPFLESTATVQ